MLCESAALVCFNFLNVLVFLVTEEENNVTILIINKIKLKKKKKKTFSTAPYETYCCSFFFFSLSLKIHIKWIFWLMYEQVSRLCEKFLHITWNLKHVVY